MKASALERPARFFVTSFSLINITETDGSKRCRQPMSSSPTHVVAVNRQIAYGYSIYYFSSTSIPMWANFSAYCLIAATGDTFFVEQSNNLKKADYLSLSVLFFLRSFICLAIKLPFGWEKVRQKCGLLMRIGAGMVCSIAMLYCSLVSGGP